MTEVRHREKHLTIASGKAFWHDDLLNPSESSYSWDEICDDTIGNRKGVNPFFLRRVTNSFWTLSGVGDPNGWRYAGFSQFGNPANHLVPGEYEPSLNELVTRGLYLSSPNIPKVDLPVFLFELKDIPRLLKKYAEAGKAIHAKKSIREIIRTNADAHITTQYGVLPFLQDIWRMMSFVDHTEKKFRELKKMASERGGNARSVVVWRNRTAGGTFTSYASSLYSEGNQLEVEWSTRREKFVSVKWIPAEEVYAMSDDATRHTANRIVTGADLSFATLWEAMPWSWLSDWFGNTDQYLGSNRNTFPVEPTRICAMQRMVTGIDSARVISGPGINTLRVSPNSEFRLELLRIPIYAPPGPESHFGQTMFDAKQLSILGAIVATKVK